MTTPLKKPFSCSACGKHFERQSKLDEHARVHTGERPFMCPKCGRCYARSQHLRRHQPSCGGPQPSTPLRRRQPTAGYTCPICPPGTATTFSRKKSVWAHLAVVHGERRHECGQCGKAFVCRSRLEAHARGHHDRQCVAVEGCEFRCREWGEMREHVRRVHPRVLKCPQCPREFFSRGNLRDHLTSHLPPDHRQLHSCPYPLCDKSYTQRRNLVQHCHRKHEGKHFPCPREGCDFQLASKQKLELHLRLHESGKPLTHQARRKKSTNKKKPSDPSANENPTNRSNSDFESDSSVKRLLKAYSSVNPPTSSTLNVSIDQESDSSIKQLLLRQVDGAVVSLDTSDLEISRDVIQISDSEVPRMVESV